MFGYAVPDMLFQFAGDVLFLDTISSKSQYGVNRRWMIRHGNIYLLFLGY